MLRALFAAITFTFVIPLTSFAKITLFNPGQTLWIRTDRYKTKVTTLRSLNNINNREGIQPIGTLRLKDKAQANNLIKDKLHTVSEGETLSGIAIKYGVDQKDIIILNDIKSSNYLYLGQILKLPSNYDAAKENPAKFHKVVHGDTLSKISMQYKKSQKELIEINNISNINVLELGQIIKLSGASSSIMSSDGIKKIEFKSQKKYHVISSGETLSTIAKAYKIPLKQLISINNTIDPNNLALGSRLNLNINLDTKSEFEKSSLNPSEAETMWRNYGPLKIDWSNWKVMNGSHVSPTLHQDGNKLYLAVNCSLRKLNATGSNGAWRTWISPEEKFEHDLINDLCKSKES